MTAFSRKMTFRTTALLSVTALAAGVFVGPAAADRGDRAGNTDRPAHTDTSPQHETTPQLRTTPQLETTPQLNAASSAFHRTATYPVFQNLPADVDPTSETVAEISTVSADGNTMIYTDAPGKRIGFVDISDPDKPVGTGVVDLSTLGDAEDEPTSVAAFEDYVLVVVNTSESFTNPSGRLDVLRISDRSRVASVDLGGQPDSIAISGDGRYAAIAIENERDEEATPAGGDEGDLPQAPAGFVQVIDLTPKPNRWRARPVALTKPNGSALPILTKAGLDTPSDPEPEYVTINSQNQLAVTLQENNGVVLIDLRRRKITGAFSAGSATVDGIDTDDDGVIDLTGSITAPREPDSIGWIDDRYLATANEGDWKGGTRGWTVFDSSTGQVAWDAGNSFEYLAVTNGLVDDGRSDNKGAEPEGLAIGTFDGHRYAFVGSERSNFVAVYNVDDPTDPQYLQILPTTNGPEGLLPIPGRSLLAVSSETDDADAGIRASVSLFELGDGTPGFPSIVSAVGPAGTPIGWGALGALTAVPDDPNVLVAASDAAYATGRIYTIDIAAEPASITNAVDVTEAGEPISLDIEGISAREQGGYWLAAEGTVGASNELVLVDDDAAVQQRISLPEEITDHVGKWGLEGVTTIGTGTTETVFVALQRPLFADPGKATGEIDGAGVARIGRYQVGTGQWSWYGYQLESTSTTGDWMGLSEITAIDDNTLAVIERDKLNGPAAAVKRIYTVDIPQFPVTQDPITVLDKTLLHDALPELRATNGWTQEKLEGLALTADGQLYAITDNDGLDEATGETVFLRLGEVAAG